MKEDKFLICVEKTRDVKSTAAGTFSDLTKKSKLSRSISRVGNSFKTILGKNSFVNKTLIIRKIVDLWKNSDETIKLQAEMKNNHPVLINAPRRFGKTTILDLSECLFGRILSREIFHKLKIGEDDRTFHWYDRFNVIYITFGFCTSLVKTCKDCINACRLNLHHSFRDIANHLPDTETQAFVELSCPFPIQKI